LVASRNSRLQSQHPRIVLVMDAGMSEARVTSDNYQAAVVRTNVVGSRKRQRHIAADASELRPARLYVRAGRNADGVLEEIGTIDRSVH
jgi:hypothetical protein